jgi:hypothetical protein
MVRIIDQLIDESSPNSRLASIASLERAVDVFMTNGSVRVKEVRFQSVLNNSGDLYYTVLIYYENTNK